MFRKKILINKNPTFSKLLVIRIHQVESSPKHSAYSPEIQLNKILQLVYKSKVNRYSMSLHCGLIDPCSRKQNIYQNKIDFHFPKADPFIENNLSHFKLDHLLSIYIFNHIMP